MEMNDIIMQPFYQFIQEAQVLLEMPQYVDHDYDVDPRELTYPDKISTQTLSEQYDYVGEIDAKGVMLELYMQSINTKRYVIGVQKELENSRYKNCIFSLSLIELNSIDDKIKSLGNECLSVSLVHCANDNRYSNISTKAYLLLAKMGYVIISDELHYKGAKSLWKKLATLGLSKVRVFDQDSDEFIIGSNGSDIYDGSNIDETVIWGNSDKMSILLILSSK